MIAKREDGFMLVPLSHYLLLLAGFSLLLPKHGLKSYLFDNY